MPTGDTGPGHWLESRLPAGLAASIAGRGAALAAAALSVFLIVYLPIEPWLLSGLQGAAYWVFRLAPDMAVVILAADTLLTRPSWRSTPLRLVWLIGLAVLAFIVIDQVRGFAAVDTINALRVVLRFTVLGLLLWDAAATLADLGALIRRAVIVSGCVQIVAGLIQAGSLLAGGAGPNGLLGLDGTTGRYDRFGLVMMALILAALVDAAVRPRPWHAPVIAAAMVLLVASSARQAMLGLAVGAALLVIVPRLRPSARFSAACLVGLSLLAVVATPSTLLVAAGSGDEGPSGSGGSSGSSGSAGPAPTPLVRGKGSTDLSVDPNRNFRLFLTLEVTPWAASVEPLVGFGPGVQDAVNTDPRIVRFMTDQGTDWPWARQFMDDSSYSDLVVQFGLVAPLLFLLLIVVLMIRAALRYRRALDPPDAAGSLLGMAMGVAMLVAAFFGPTFEIRTTAVVLWAVLAMAQPTSKLMSKPMAKRV